MGSRSIASRCNQRQQLTGDTDRERKVFVVHGRGPATEHALYDDTAARLTALGWPICNIDSTDRAPGAVAAIVTDRILTLHADRSAHDYKRPVIPDIQHR